MTQPEERFWHAVVTFFSDEVPTEAISHSRDRSHFTTDIPQDGSIRARECILGVLQLLNALRRYDRSRGTDFAERLKMLFWRFASAFIASDDEVDPRGEEALTEFRRALDEELATVGEANATTRLFEQLQHTISDLETPVFVMTRISWNEGEEAQSGDQLLVTSLNGLLIHIAFTIGSVDDDEVRFYRAFSFFFGIYQDAVVTRDLSYWRELLQHHLRQSNPVCREIRFPIVECLASYDKAHGTEHAEQCRTMYFRLANAFVKANGSVSHREKELLLRLNDLLHNQPRVVDPTSPAAETESPTLAAASGFEEDRSVSDVLRELDSLIGLEDVKKDVARMANFLEVQRLRVSRGLAPATVSRHLVFSGNPGTGKTTVARLLAEIYRALGVLRRGHLFETDRSGLVAGYLGQTALKVQEVVRASLGGVLFIDEAYALVERQDDSFGQEALDTLLKLMEDHRDDLVVVVAGYTENMKQFVAANPGLRSRFNKYLAFPDYSPDELARIFDSFCAKTGFIVTPAAREKLESLFATLYEARDKSFGNGRLARNIFETAIHDQATRIIGDPYIDEQILCTIEAEDIPGLADVANQ